jgi:heterodisulfide reductase subunit A-like polyferredoxin
MLLKEYLEKLLKIVKRNSTCCYFTSIDARQKAIKINLKWSVYLNLKTPLRLPEYGNVATAQEVIVIGAGPAGLFAAG